MLPSYANRLGFAPAVRSSSLPFPQVCGWLLAGRLFLNVITMKYKDIRSAAEAWVNEFNFVPGSVFEQLAEANEDILFYESDNLRLLSSPWIECSSCNASCEDDKTLTELQESFENGVGIPCEYCEHNTGDKWVIGRPEYAFPCGWGTLFAPKSTMDIEWVIENSDEIAQLGFFVFESDEWGVLLGIDAGGFDFYEAYWIPLYKLRGLQWHDCESQN